MSRSRLEKYLTQALTVSTQYTESIDISDYNGAAIQLNSAVASGAGTVGLEGSIDGLQWTSLGTPGTIATGRGYFQVSGVQYGFVRGVITLSAGAGNYNIYIMIKRS